MLAEAKKEAERIIKTRVSARAAGRRREVTKQAERAAEDIVEDARAASADQARR